MGNLITDVALYDFMWEAANVLIKKHNPCRMRVVDGQTLCSGARGPCCQGCKHRGPKGCEVRCLICKIHLCEDAKKRLTRPQWPMEHMFFLMNHIYWKYPWVVRPDMRESREHWLKESKRHRKWKARQKRTVKTTLVTIADLAKSGPVIAVLPSKAQIKALYKGG